MRLFAGFALVVFACGCAPEAPLRFEVPWADGEESHYDVLDARGVPLGAITWSLTRAGDGWTLAETSTASGKPERGDVTLDRALGVLPEVRLDAAQADALGHGQFVEAALDDAATAAIGAGPRTIALRELSGRALALGELVREGDGRVLARPNVVFPWAVREGRAA
jgi:hypothetical protein